MYLLSRKPQSALFSILWQNLRLIILKTIKTIGGSGANYLEQSDRAYFTFSLRGKHRFPYLQDHGPRSGDLRCVELSFFDFVCQLDSAQCYFRIPVSLEPQHRITSLRRLPMILLNHVIQVLAGPDERLSGQDALGLQFSDGLMGRLAAVERDLLRDLMIAERFPEEAYRSR